MESDRLLACVRVYRRLHLFYRRETMESDRLLACVRVYRRLHLDVKQWKVTDCWRVCVYIIGCT